MAQPQPSTSASEVIVKTAVGSHDFIIQGYSLAKGMGIGNYISSAIFTVGGHDWAVCFYPDGLQPIDNAQFVSVYIVLVSHRVPVTALFELKLLDQSGGEQHMINSHFNGDRMRHPYTFKERGRMWGFKQYIRRSILDTSYFLKDDCLRFWCKVGVVVVEDVVPPDSVPVPEPNFAPQLGFRLDDLVGSDVTFNVAGEKFSAHKLVLNTRSSEFLSKFSNDLDMGNQEIIVTDLEPKILKAMLHFIYSDTLIEEVVTVPSTMPVSETPKAKLLAAANKYGLERLKLMCESIISKDIQVSTAANILTLADQCGALQLKGVCLKFVSRNLPAVIVSAGYEELKEKYPWLQLEILNTIVAIEDDGFDAGEKSGSSWTHPQHLL